PGGHQRPTATSGQENVLTGHEVGAGVARMGVRRQVQIGVESLHGNVHGDGRAYDPHLMLVWMDLEMTGLDPAQHTIVEIACLITDDDLELVAEGPDIVVHQPPEALAAMDRVVRAMHTESGLLAEVEESTVSLSDAGAQVLAFIGAHVPDPSE